MKIAVIGSRSLKIPDLQNYLPADTTEIVSGGATGIDACAKEYAEKSGILLTEFLPEYTRYGRAAPLERNRRIVSYADHVIAFWDGTSRGTSYVIDFCKKHHKPITVYRFD